MFRKILVPFDRSEASRHALAQALDLVEDEPDATVTVLTVTGLQENNAETFKIASRMAGVTNSSLDMTAIADVGEKVSKEISGKIAKEIADIVGDSQIVNIAVINGSAHDSIAPYATEGGYDCIVMGHRGQGSVRGMIGSVCYSVLNKTEKPVLIVK